MADPGSCFTRCQHCRAILPLDVTHLAQAGGMVRCGECGRTLNALASLYPAFPGDDVQAIRPSGMPPMLQPYIKQEDMITSFDQADPAPREEDRRGPVLHLDLESEPAPRWSRWAWPLVVLLLLGMLALQLFGPERWRVEPSMFGLAPTGPVLDAQAVRLVSRDMHPHPSLSDAWVISAVLENRGRDPIAWPQIELRLYDSSQQIVARKRLSPEAYLDDNASTESVFRPDMLLPVVLEVSVSGSQPSGFSMTFHD